MVALYLLIGIAVVGALYWALTQITVRQRRLNAELTRLEQLTAEVSMNAGAILERIEQRTVELTALLAAVDARVEALPGGGPAQAPAEATPAPRKRSRTKKQEPPAPSVPASVDPAPQPALPPAPAVTAAEVPAPVQRYQELRTAAWTLADQGKESGAIAEALGIPRGEAELLLNLRGKKVSA